MNDVILTVVIPAHNRQGCVRDTVRSVLQQADARFELILVDNGSTDATPEILGVLAAEASSQGIDARVFSESRRGACAARNRGLREVRTPWTMFFDSDDIMHPGHLSRALATLEANPKADIIGWNTEIEFADRKIRTIPFETDDSLWHNLMHGTLSTQRYMARTDLFRRVGGWNEDIPIWNDIELGTRLLALKPRLAKADGKPSVTIRRSADSISGLRFSDRAGLYEKSLQSIERNLPDKAKWWVDIKRAILAGNMSAEGSGLGKPLHCDVRRRHRGFRRLLLDAIYHYVLISGRGAARIIRPCVSFRF